MSLIRLQESKQDLIGSSLLNKLVQVRIDNKSILALKIDVFAVAICTYHKRLVAALTIGIVTISVFYK